MRRTHRLSARSQRWTCVCICSALILSSLTLITPASSKSGFVFQGRSGQGTNRNVKKITAKPPQPGAPALALPNLDDGRRRRNHEPRAPRQIESNIRSRRKPVESRRGRKVGDPLPPRQKAGIEGFGDASERVRIAVADARGSVGTVRSHHARTARSLLADVNSSSVSLLSLVNSNHRLSIRPASTFLRYPALHSDLNISATAKVLADSYALRSSFGVMNQYLPAANFNLFTSPVPQAGASKIVFASNRDGSMQIYVMNADGSGVTRLTYSGANDDYPRWSPNGAKILFQSDRDHPDTGYMDIYVMNSDGGGVTRLTTDTNDDSMPSWSSDGSKIVFQSMRNGVNYQVYSMNADGSNQVNLTNSSSSDGEPSWSADGTKIAFASDRDHAGYDSVYVMNSNGTNQHAITSSGATIDDTQPVWSKDGSKIAFVTTRDSTTETWQETDDDGNYITKSKLHINKEVYVMNADGLGQLRLTNDLANDDSPSWSPDGSKIVFRSDRERDCCDPSAQVWTMNADGSAQSNVSNDGVGNYTASWTSGSGNQLPIANAGGTYSGVLSQNVPFHSTNSYDPDGTIVSYSWNFGDGGISSSAAPTHAYTNVGAYTATLTVTDNLGAQSSASATVTISASSSDQYSVNFLQAGLGRSLIGNEGTYWTDIMRAAYSQGQPSMLMAMNEFGMTVFESAEYVGRNRSDHDYVYDLYETYLMRYPDQDGWDYWTTQASPLHMGRAQVRTAFEESPEFHNIVATLAASGNPSTAAASLSTARTDPFNQSGDQVQARDCEFGVPLVSLPGRAGLDLGLSLSYSSLVWTQSGPYVYFDPDSEGLSPGFTIGFPSIQWRSFEAQTARNVYLLTAGGHRVELRQLGNSNVYESYDSSYLQLIDYGNNLTLKTTDGTQIGFGAFANGWQATSVEDRNGNVMTISNYWWGEIHTITDTLGRILTFNNDGSSNLISITQSWSGQQQPHTWVTFGWGTATLHPSFSSEVVGTFDSENIPVLTMVGLADGSYNKFGYNGNGQVSQMTHYASDSNPVNDNHPLNTTVYDYALAGVDCPRLSEQRVSAENWTSVNGLPPYALTQFSDPGDDSRQMITPDNTTYKEFFGTGWQHGLVTSTQVIAASTVQKSTTTSYVQDNTSVNYQTNPRVTAADISDGTNHSRTTVGYDTFALPSGTSCSLPNDVYEYDADQTTPLRRTHTDYNRDTNYLNQRIIGLPQARLLYEGVSALKSKTTFVYDWGGEYLQGLPAVPTQHDGYYSQDLWLGRGNLVDMVRWDATDPDNSSKAWETKTAYNIDGSILFTRDPLGHQTSMSYAESFWDGNNSRNTFAYPTTLTDPDGGQSFIQYNYDFGAKTRFEGPPPQDKPNGIVQTFAYDDAIRVRQVTTTYNGAYSRYLYGPTNVVMLSSINVIGDEAYTNTTFDGLGRSLGVATNNPGSTGGYKAQLTQYDIMGRAMMQSNPTEIDGWWNPSGDDSAGYIYTQQTYDWKSRPLETRHLTDGAVKYASYVGCGCAGGDVVTLTDEAGRQQKVYSDAIGRQWKTEILNDGAIYSADVSVYNARDQITNIKQYSGQAAADASSTNPTASCPTGTCKESSTAYDGYGRIQSTHDAEQDAPTVYAYNGDDTVSSVTDARGASATYLYNNYRGLVNGINYFSPSGVASTSNVSFTYDAAGNRTSMSDGTGSLTYSYDTLSRLQSETKQFSGPGAPSGNFTLAYDYNFANQVKSVTDQRSGTSFNNNYDNIGRVTSASGVGYGGVVTPFASQMLYRASGALKSLAYGNNTTLSLEYNGRGLVTSYADAMVGTGYQYYADGRLKFARDQSHTPEAIKDRAYKYDHAGRIAESYSGAEARDFVNNTNSGLVDGPFRQTYSYDAWDNQLNESGRFWSRPELTNASYNSANRNTAWSYDTQGNVLSRNDGTSVFQAAQYGYDAASRAVSSTQNSGYYSAEGGGLITQAASNSQSYDGDDQLLRNERHLNISVNGSLRSSTNETTYSLRSSVLNGAVVSEYNEQGTWQSTYVYAGSQRVGQQSKAQNGTAFSTWRHVDPVTGDEIITTTAATMFGQTVLDSQGVDVGNGDPFPPDGSGDPNGIVTSQVSDKTSAGLLPIEGGGTKCVLDGIEMDCW